IQQRGLAQDMVQQRSPRQALKHLGQAAFHARALAGGHDEDVEWDHEVVPVRRRALRRSRELSAVALGRLTAQPMKKPPGPFTGQCGSWGDPSWQLAEEPAPGIRPRLRWR